MSVDSLEVGGVLATWDLTLFYGERSVTGPLVADLPQQRVCQRWGCFEGRGSDSTSPTALPTFPPFMPEPEKPTVASYCTTFLKPEMRHIYRQVTGLQRYQTFVLTRERKGAEQFPF